jgi:dienelactone hydrolase
LLGRQATCSKAPAKRALRARHENKGLTDHIRHVAGRFAAAGYAALAIDLLSAEGGTASLGEPAQATAALSKVAPDRVNATRGAAKAALEKAGLVHEIVTYPGEHAFHNDTGPRYDAESASKAWAKVLEWFGAHLR